MNMDTPVAFFIFNRPDTTAEVFRAIEKAKPKNLLLIADGARNKAGDMEKVLATRSIVEKTSWDCEVLKNFSDINLGCKVRVSSGLDWVFDRVSEAIILEDDCLPNDDCFKFCSDLLEKYRLDRRIGMVSGHSQNIGLNPENGDSYYFSKYFHIWGWATWRDRWVGHYDVNMCKWPAIKNENWLENIFDTEQERRYWIKKFDSTYRGDTDTWDYQWFFANLIEGRYSIAPASNLITNIGLAHLDATRKASYSSSANRQQEAMSWPLKHPMCVIKNTMLDSIEAKDMLHRPPFMKRKLNKLRRWIERFRQAPPQL